MKFPITIFDEKDPMVYSFPDEKSLKKSSEELFAKNVWKSYRFIDSDGYEYSVLDVRRAGTRGFMGWNPLLKGKQIWVEFDLSERKSIDVDVFKSILLNRVSLSESFWEESYDIDELKEEIRQSHDFETLIKFFL